MRKFVTLSALFVCACGEPSQVSETGSTDETFNERVERQTKYIPALKRNQLPAPDGEAVSVARNSANRSSWIVTGSPFGMIQSYEFGMAL